jgi:hypothetical protein
MKKHYDPKKPANPQKGVPHMFKFFILLLSVVCCKQDIDYQYPAFITTGQNSGLGVSYTDIEPDDTICYYYCYPYKIYSLDLDKDKIDDVELRHEVSYPYILSGGYSKTEITPLANCSVVVSPINPSLVDSLNIGDTINIHRSWSDSTVLLYSYHWSIMSAAKIEGYWFETDKHYIGIKISKPGYQLYGWIDYDFHATKIRDFAITTPF